MSDNQWRPDGPEFATACTQAGAKVSKDGLLVARAQQAIYVLEQARRIRADSDLMVAVRAQIRKLRDDGAALLDSLG